MIFELQDCALPLNFTHLKPFGLLIEPSVPLSNLSELPAPSLCRLAMEHRILVLRGFPTFPTKESMAEYCEELGQILKWDFGSVFEVVEHDNPNNYLFTNGSVPFHWDGAFAVAVPTFQFFQCLETPGSGAGGETLFCDTISIWAQAEQSLRSLWENVTINYFTEKKAHYGGSITAPLVSRHPHSGLPVLRFAEPANETTVELNTPELEIIGIPPEQHQTFIRQLRELLYDPRFLYKHEWQAGDLLIADNQALLHGRNPYKNHSPRRLWRVHIL